MKVNKLKGIDAVIFDLDGTLWNPTNTCLEAWHHALNSISYVKETVSEKDIEGIFGLQHDLIGEKLFPYLTKEQKNAVMQSCYDSEIKMIIQYGGELYYNLEKVLNTLSKKYKLYIVSNCQSGYVEAFYEFHKLNHYFLDHECSGNTGLSKKNNIKMIIERNNLKNPLFVGDTLGDYEASKANNIPFIFAKYGFGNVDDAEIEINSLYNLIEIL